MAKVAFTKLGLTKNTDIVEVDWNGQKIEVKQYLPMNDKLELCSRIVNESADDLNFYNPGKVAVYQTIEVILAYTNISVTEKQREDVCKLYDLFSNGLLQEVFSHIPEVELGAITSIVEATLENIYKYKNSALGIMQAMSDDYGNLKFDAQTIQKMIGDGENVEFLKEVLTKLG